MKIITEVRGAGKTTQAVALAKSAHAYLVVRDQYTARRIKNEFGLEREPFTYADVISERMRGLRASSVVIDDADDFIRFCLRPFTVLAITITGGTDVK